MLIIFVVSDATGETAERVVRSALVQFESANVELVRRGGIQTSELVRATVREAAGKDALILHTLVSDELRRLMLAESRALGVDALDLMGPVLGRLATHLRLTPQERPGLFRQLTEAQAREIEAVEFAFRHDDGQRIEEISQAEVVLVGVSRTMKTPTMLYLAYRGWFSANVPIVLGVDPPESLRALAPERVTCLVMAPARLAELRAVRSEHLGIPAEPYCSLDHVRRELRYAQRMARTHQWRVIDVSGKSVEEVAQEILVALPARLSGLHSREAV
jgi:regulator of PEP synthase PpsR (kinase-PPPase family)